MGKYKADLPCQGGKYTGNSSHSKVGHAEEQLGPDNKQPMGVRKHRGSQVRVNGCADTREGSRRSTPPLRARRMHGKGDLKFFKEEGSNSVPATPTGVYIMNVSSAQERQLTQTNNRLGRVGKVHSLGALQAGRNPSGKRPPTGERLASKAGYQRGVFCNPNSMVALKVAPRENSLVNVLSPVAFLKCSLVNIPSQAFSH